MYLDEQQEVQNLLTSYFITASEKNPSFSLRAFANKLGISSSSLSEILRGKRRVSLKMAQQFLETLNAPVEELERIHRLFDKMKDFESLSKLPNPLKEVILSETQFELMADWKYFTVLALLRVDGFSTDLAVLSQRLSLTIEDLSSVIENLIKWDILKRDSLGRLTEEGCCFGTPKNYPDKMIRSRQIEGLNSAIDTIEQKIEGQNGYFSTVSVDPKKLDQANDMMLTFLKKLSVFLSSGDSAEVFELHLQLFPRTKPL